jgi:hypothetical protein
MTQWWHPALAVMLLLLAPVVRKLLTDETLDCLEDGPRLIIRITSRIMAPREREHFREYCTDDLDQMQEQERHQAWHLGRAYAYAIMQLVRAPARRLAAQRAVPTSERLGVPPAWMLQLWRTRYMFHRGQAIPRDTAVNRRLTWVYRVHRQPNIDGPIVVRSIRLGFGLQATALTVPWPGRTGGLFHRPTVVAVLREGVPVIGVTKRRFPEQPGARWSIEHRR